MPNAGGVGWCKPGLPSVDFVDRSRVSFFLSFVLIFYLVVLDRMLKLNGYPRGTSFF